MIEKGKRYSESTGGLGIHFEERVDVIFLLIFLIDGYCPILNEKITELNFQSTDYKTDDLVVCTNGIDGKKKLLCQMKHTVKVSDKNEDFVNTIIDAWTDFTSSDFKVSRDKIVLICSSISVQSKSSILRLHSKTLNALKNGVQFSTMLRNKRQFGILDCKTVDIIENIINSKFENKVNDEMMYDFFRSFTILQIDVDYFESSFHYPLATSLIVANSAEDPENVWDNLYNFVSISNQSGSYVTIDNIPLSIRNLFNKAQHFNSSIFDPIPEIDNFILILAFVGDWDESNKNDQIVIQNLFGDQFSEFKKKAKAFAAKNSDLITIVDNKWHVNGREDILNQCKLYLFDEEIQTLISTAKEVLECDLISHTGKWNVSKKLRKNLVSSLCWVRVNLEAIPNCNHDYIEKSFNELIYSLFESSTSLSLASLSDCVVNLAQLSPNIFMDRLENNLIHNKHSLSDLFQNNNNYITEGYITNYLTALKILAWAPEYTVRAISILGRLDYFSSENSNWYATPAYSIYTILVPWNVQTLADSDIKISSLVSLKNDVPDVFWKIICKLMPTIQDGVCESEKPKYLSISFDNINKPTDSQILTQYQRYIQLAIDFAKDDKNKLIFIAKNIGFMNADSFADYLCYIENVESRFDDDSKDKLWCDLYDQIDTVKKNPFFFSKDKDKFEQLIDRLDTNNILVKYSHLYSWSIYKDLKDEEKIECERRKAIKEIYHSSGIKAVIRFANIVDDNLRVLYTLGECISVDGLSSMFDEYCARTISFDFLNCCLNGYFKKHAMSDLLQTNLPFKDHNIQVEILGKLLFSKPLYQVVIKLNIEDEYWEKCNSFRFYINDEFNELLFVIDHLKKHKRYVTALNIIGTSSCIQNLGIDKIIEILERAVNSSENTKIENYAVCKLLDYVHDQNSISLEEKARLDMLYLPCFDSYTTKSKPKALFTRISTDPKYFCELINSVYGNKNGTVDIDVSNKNSYEITKLLLDFQCIPGMDLDGTFNINLFNNWIDYVKKWSIEHDLYRISMHTVGCGLSYAIKYEDHLPNETILTCLNEFDNEELREGYKTALFNHVGGISITPEGKDELEIAHGFEECAKTSESKGYSRVSTLYKELAEEFSNDAKTNYKRFVSRLDD